MKYNYIDRYRHEHAVKTLCKVLEVSRSGYYAFKKAPVISIHSRQDLALRQEIIRVHNEHHWIPGAVKMWHLLNAQGICCGKHRVSRLRKLDGVKSNRSNRLHRKQAMARDHAPVMDLVQRGFQIALPNRVWVGDMTAIRTTEGCLHLAIVLDLCARRVVGWAVEATPNAALPEAALRMAIDQRRPAPGLIFHSDQGSAYCASSYRALLARHGMLGSMSRKGNCHDNAVAESFFSNLKNEILQERLFATRAEATSVIQNYIESYYNRLRLHQTLQYQTPEAVEVQLGVLI